VIRSLLYTPIQAYRCSISGIAPIDGTWSQEAVEYFKKEIMDADLVKSIRVLDDIRDGRAVVKLEIEVPNAAKCANVGSLLIEKGFAKAIQK